MKDFMLTRYIMIASDHLGEVSDVVKPGMQLVSKDTGKLLGVVKTSDAFGAHVRFTIRGLIWRVMNRRRWQEATFRSV